MELWDKFKRLEHPTEEKSDDQSIQYGKTRVHRNESNSPSEDCLHKCLNGCFGFDPMRQASQPYLQESARIDVSSVLKDIGDDFHILAESVSVL